MLNFGGKQGRLREYLRPDEEYSSSDPYVEVFTPVDKQAKASQGLPMPFEPCNLVAAHAEPLRLAERSFATVHTRSVIDHFRAPALTLIESSGFEVDKAHWQAGWNDRVCHIRAQKPAQ